MKPPSGKGRAIECPDLSGQMQRYAADAVKFRPAAYGILHDQESVLLARSRFTGRWDFPGGGVEPFEWLGDGMVREYFEETGLTIEVGELVHVAEAYVAMFGHPFHSLRFYYRCRLTGRPDLQPEPREVTDLRWWPIADLPLSDMHETDRRAFEAFRTRLEGGSAYSS